MTSDPFAQFKAVQREAWAAFAPLESATTAEAAKLVRFAGVRPGAALLDVACGTGVVAITAARAGAKVKGLDLSPVLLEHARSNAQLAGTDVELTEGDAENLPYPDASFDVVLSQFGHMFAPQPKRVVSEMLRVLKPGGRIAFSTWPPELLIGQMFTLVARYAPPPEGVAPPPQWGDPNVVRERLGDQVTELSFDRDVMLMPALSPAHHRATMERTAGPATKVVAMLQNDQAKLAQFRRELEALSASCFADNYVRQPYLMTRASKRQ